MTVFIDFHMDTSGEDGRTVTVQSPYADKSQTRDKINERLDDTATSPKALMPIRDADTGDYHFVNTMKLADVKVYKS